MKRAIIVCGPKMSGAGFLAGILIGGGARGQATVDQPDAETIKEWMRQPEPIVLLEEGDIAQWDLDDLVRLLRKGGRDVAIIFAAREPLALLREQRAAGLQPDKGWGFLAEMARAEEAWPSSVTATIFPMSSLTLHPIPVIQGLLERYGLEWARLEARRSVPVGWGEFPIIQRDPDAECYGEVQPSPDPETGSHLVWWPELEMGYFPVRGDPYGPDYFERYRAMDQSPMADRLNASRMAMVLRHLHWPDPDGLIDVGVGGGRFRSDLEAWGAGEHRIYGYDVSPPAEEMLRDLGRFRDPYIEAPRAVTCWDSLEHIPQPWRLVNRVREWVFISVPIFEGPEHVLRSRHYRRDEHYWYWTEPGLVRWFRSRGWNLVESNDVETQLGREDIRSFAFRRRRVGDA